MNNKFNGYDLSRKWFDWFYENTSRANSHHTAFYFYCVDLCNRLGWKKEFGLPSAFTMEALGIKSYNTYIKTLNDLVSFGFIILVQKSTNQFTSNIVALSNFDTSLDNSLYKAMTNHYTKHSTKQSESTVQSTVQSNDSIDKQLNLETTKPLNNQTGDSDLKFPFESNEFKNTWNQFIEFRKSIKKPLKEISQQAQLLKLSKFTENNATEMIMQSIENGWQGIFEIKNNTNNNLKNGKSSNRFSGS